MLLLFPLHLFDREVYSCCHNLMTVIQSYFSKNTHRALLYAVKIAEAVFLYAFTMVFPTSPFMGARQCYSLLPPTLIILRKEEVIPGIR